MQCVAHKQFQRALHRAAAGIGAGLAFKYDARRDETVWTIDGLPVGLTVGPIGATRACYLATSAAVTKPGKDRADRGRAAVPLAPAATSSGRLAACRG